MKFVVSLIFLVILGSTAIADDIPPTDNGGANGQSTGAQNVPENYTGAGSGANGAPGSGGTSASGDNSALNTVNQICGGNLIDPTTQELKIFSVGVKCFENITAGLAESTIQTFSSDLAQIVYVMLVLYVIFFGVKVATGVTAGGRLKSEAYVTLIKIAVVAFLVYGFDGGFNISFGSSGVSAFGSLGIENQPGLVQMYAMVISSYHSMLTIVMPTNGFGNCSSGATAGASGTDAVWQSMDCMLSKFIGWNEQNGYATGSGAGNKGGIAMLLGYISAKMLPANGFFIGTMVFSSLMTLLSGFFRLAFVYVISMIALILLFSIGPMMVPLMLFKKTESYFESWLKVIIGVILQPVILFAFFSFIAGLLTNIIEQVEKLFSDMQLKQETSGVDQIGDKTDIHTTPAVDSLSNMIDKMDIQMILNAVIILVLAYLMVTFIKNVGNMAAELAGVPLLNLSEAAPKFFEFGGIGG